MFSRFSARTAIDFGNGLAQRFSERYPPNLDKAGAPQVSANRLARIMEGLCIEAQSFRDQHSLGFYRRARLAHAFKWRLMESGYSNPLIEAATEALVVYLGRPSETVPELVKAQDKRTRKANQAKNRTTPLTEPSASNSQLEVFDRTNPSPRYAELVRLYRHMHEHGESFLGIPPEQTFPGQSHLPQAARIKRLITLTGSRSILDYGSGKGQQYKMRDITPPGESQNWENVQSYYGVSEIRCYDPAFVPFSEVPEGKFDGVVSTDVLEHCPQEDIPWILDEIFSYASKFVFANVACYPARKRLPTGDNAHCTIQPMEWWEDLIRKCAEKHSGISYEVWVQWKNENNELVEDVISG